MNILITGKNGYIAKSLANKLNEKYSVVGIGKDNFDLTDRESTNEWFKDKHFDVVIHTAVVGGSRLKQDDEKVFFQNLSMFYNLLSNQDKFNQLISFGSGAELGYPVDPYGLSKNIINKIIQNEPKFNNIRIFAVFDENELDTRFIKSNITKYLNKKPMQVYQNKAMDFFYMPDLVDVVEYYINEKELLKEFDCIYPHPANLIDITNTINKLGNYEVDIINQDKNGNDYISKHRTALPIEFIGLEEGIKQVYNKLK